MKPITCFFALLIFCSFGFAQTQKGSPSLQKLFFEKVYIHTDREQYSRGEDIWFKAYLINAQSGWLFNSSNNMYVELINANCKIVDYKIIRMDDGLGKGDFTIGDSIVAGVYRIRAYTNWMRNFGDNFVFEKSIRIFSEKLVDTQLASGKKEKKFENELNPPLKDSPVDSLRFFPEGGYLIENTDGIVAFKSEDSFGKGIGFKGIVTTKNGVFITEISTLTGMGKFILNPVSGEQYIVKGINSNGKELVTELPSALAKGLSMMVKNADSVISISINTNQSTLDELKEKELTILFKNKGVLWLKNKILLQGLSSVWVIPKSQMPAGISSVTIYDPYGKPHCERLIYNEGERVYMSIVADQSFYQPKAKTTLAIKVTDQGNRPVKASLSIAVTDAGIVPENNMNIASYLNLQSEIRGKIEDPDQYLDEKNPNRRQQLDLLLLTQGWREYVWRKIQDTSIRISYALEQGMSITGQVRRIMWNSPIAGINITMFAPKAVGDKIYFTKTDSDGNFYIDGPKLFGYQFVRFTARRDKGKGGGWIKLDSLHQHKLPVRESPFFNQDTTVGVLFQDPYLDREKAKKRVNLSDTLVLKTIVLNARKNILSDQTFQLRLEDQKQYSSLMDYLVDKIPGAYRESLPNGVVLMQDYRYPIVVSAVHADNSKINPKTVDFSGLLFLPLDHILKVTIHSYVNSKNRIVYSAIAAVRPGSLERSNFYDNLVADIMGYYNARHFYAPNYETASSKTDLRTTIYWQPSIVTNEKGEASISYYNADSKTKVRIAVEGVSEKGIPITGTATYEVK